MLIVAVALALVLCGGAALCESDLTPVEMGELTPVEMGEWRALARLYRSTGGSDWVNGESWAGQQPTRVCVNASFSAYHGVRCMAGRVLAVDLDSNNLVGNLEDVANLTGLDAMQELHLSTNSLRGFASEWSGADALSFLDLSKNYLSGSLSAWRGLPSLGFLSLGRNTAVEGTLNPLDWEATQLDDLDVGGCALSGTFPGNWSAVPFLVTLGAPNNFISGEFPTAVTAPRLRSLRLEGNRLSGDVPSLFTDTPLLADFSLAENLISGTLVSAPPPPRPRA